MTSLNEVRRNSCSLFLKELSSIEKVLTSDAFKDQINELENYLDQFFCLKNSKILFGNEFEDVKEKTLFKINLFINEKFASISLTL